MSKDIIEVEAKPVRDITPIQEAQTAALDSPRAVMLSPAQLRKQMKRDEDMRAVIDEYIKNNMIAGKDYGTITVKSKSGKEYESKPSLLKPGAEKFCGLFKIRPSFRKDDETAEMLGNTPGIIAYICELVDTRGRVIGEGRGTAKADVQGLDFDINKQVKIAEKRAQIDAVLRAGGLSDFFTQDMEDASSTAAPKPATHKQINMLRVTAQRITGDEDDSSLDNFIEEVIGYRPEQLGIKAVWQANKKLLEYQELLNDRQKEEASQDVVVTDIPDDINLDNVPY